MRIRKSTLVILTLAVFFSAAFWSFHSLWSVAYFGTDLTRYYLYFKFDTLKSVSDMSWAQDKTFYFLMWLVKSLGISFSGFLFVVIFGYYIAVGVCLRWLLKTTNVLLVVISFCILSFWLQSLVLVALRQGVAFLFILLAFCASRANSMNITVFCIFALGPLMHLSAIMFAVFAFLKNLVLSVRGLIDTTYLVVVVAYSFGVFTLLNAATVGFVFDRADILRSLMHDAPHYITGPTFSKGIASAGPLILMRLISCVHGWNSRLSCLYYYSVSISILGMVASGFQYHDRILLYGWCLSSLLIPCSIWLFAKPKRFLEKP